LIELDGHFTYRYWRKHKHMNLYPQDEVIVFVLSVKVII
jgi:hypothetical protein